MIGVYGGTFNPIHQGHLRAAEEVVEELGLSRMLFVPSARPPHKLDDPSAVIAPAALRTQWVELAIMGNSRFELSTIEVDRPGPSYLVDTLEQLGRLRPAEQLVFVVGQDAFREMGSWRAPRELFRLCHIAVMTRPPQAAGDLSAWLPECVQRDFEVSGDGMSARHREVGSWIRQLVITALDISASDIRARLGSGRSVRYLMPEAVRTAVEGSACYTAIPSEPPSAAAVRK